MPYKISITGDTLDDLQDALAALMGGDEPANVAATSMAGAGSIAAEAPKRRGRPPKAAPDPAPVGAATTVEDPFATAAKPDDSGDDPFGAPTSVAMPAINPSVAKLIERLEQKAKEVGEPRLLSYAVRMLGLSPSMTLAQVFENLLSGKQPQESIDRMLDQTGGR